MSVEVQLSPQARVIRGVKQWVTEGRFSQGEPLPAERVLAEHFGVGRNTVRKALARLDDEGFFRRETLRSRIITDGPTTDVGWLARAVAVLSPLDEGVKPKLGYMEAISYGAISAIRGSGLHAITLHPQLSDAEVRRLAADRPLGLIVPEISHSGPETSALVAALAAAKVPLVVYGGQPELAAYDRVLSDHDAGSYELTKLMLARGRRRVVNAWSEPHDRYWLVRRRAGYDRAMTEAGLAPSPIVTIPVLPRLEDPGVDFADLVRRVAGYLIDTLTGPDAADAILCGTDRETFYVSAACRLFGKAPGRDVLVAGYDNYYDACRELALEPTPPVATVDKMNVDIGRCMVELLVDRVAGRLGSEPVAVGVAPRVIEPGA